LQVFARGVAGGELAPKDGRRYWRWSYRNGRIAEPEPASVSSLDYGPLIAASTFHNYGELAKAYDAHARPKAAVTQRVRALANELTGSLHDQRARAKAIYDWVAKTSSMCKTASVLVPWCRITRI
jgi:transglutaminase-like putative cysteine protease